VEGEGFQISLNSRAATTIGTGDGEGNGSHRKSGSETPPFSDSGGRLYIS